MNECERARHGLGHWADGELLSAEGEWLENHWAICADCRSERNRFQAFDTRLLSLGSDVGAPSETLLTIRRRKAWMVIPAASLLAAGILMTIRLPQTPQVHEAPGDNDGFVAVPYIAPIAAYERSSVISQEIAVADLLALGFSVEADPASVVQADLLLGEDGWLEAVRLAPNQMLKGASE